MDSIATLCRPPFPFPKVANRAIVVGPHSVNGTMGPHSTLQIKFVHVSNHHKHYSHSMRALTVLFDLFSWVVQAEARVLGCRNELTNGE